MNKIKTLIGIGLTSTSVMAGVVVATNGNILDLSRAENTYICEGNIRLEPNGDGTYKITHIGAGATTVNISSELLERYNVTNIEADAFDDCRNTLTDITIDASVPMEDGALSNMANELDITFTGDVTEITYGHIFENTTIGTMTIPETVTYVTPETFYGVTDTTNFVYEGSFDDFWGTKGSDGIFGSLWTAFQNTMNSSTYTSASMPTNIQIGEKTYSIPNDSSLSSTTVRYYNGNKDAFGYRKNKYYKTNNNL